MASTTQGRTEAEAALRRPEGHDGPTVVRGEAGWGAGRQAVAAARGSRWERSSWLGFRCVDQRT
jgi:hypothetical protein